MATAVLQSAISNHDSQSALVLDAVVVDELIRARRSSGHDSHDEVWDEIYHLAPMANDGHQGLATLMAAVFCNEIDFKSAGSTRAGVNVSDRVANWGSNFRCPDVAVFLSGTSAVNHQAFWCGGPDFAVEIVSPNDRTRDKLDFYATVGTHELLIIDRDPWQLELMRLEGGKLVSTGIAKAGDNQALNSTVLPFAFSLSAVKPRPILQVQHMVSGQTWQL